ncbi:MAG TPA: GAF domain-containing protein [Ramlibacter sp.]|jgi:GAF domain-containing protein|uniref:GAF domain-containing protein n=1 Tax=Ramlibacter sp. TaxID=1917967 RepID=UPI002D30504F|nr:GAF domain-containing protein [Ramlibacter sp.]HZY19648.1 GAF domain-containing protein [Ramlibacter sp.]
MRQTDLSQLWAASSRLVELASGDAPLDAVLTEVAAVAQAMVQGRSRSSVVVGEIRQACIEGLPGAGTGGRTASRWSFPILSNTAVLGTIDVQLREPRDPSRSEIAALRYLATIASAAIDRERFRLAPIRTRPRGPRDVLPPPGLRAGEGMDSIRRFMAADQHGDEPTP